MEGEPDEEILELDHVVHMKVAEKELPIGRSYKEKAKEQYVAYGKEKIKGRI